LVTCIGVGSATITAICGEQTATCAVSATSVINANTDLFHQDGQMGSGTDMSAGKDYVGLYASNRGRIYLSETITPTGQKAISGYDTSPWNALYPIMIPSGASKISISAPTKLCNHINIVLLDSTSQPTYGVSKKGVKAVSNSVDIKTAKELDLADYSGYDSFVITFQTANDDASTVTEDVTITLS
jgi:hypothetical protein